MFKGYLNSVISHVLLELEKDSKKEDMEMF